MAINKLGNGNNEGYVKGYEGLKQPFTKLTVCILMSYGIFMKGEGLTDEFIAIYNILVTLYASRGRDAHAPSGCA